ncbi:FAD-dependent oxidoreductase [Streptomyces sp. NPDC006465]|uniref:FAD-dependent oxidoreductase n=1 Tax=Streptomyces sp. NPDC006465 TaxID=3157174 RepID=UPI0033A48325
MTPRRVVLLGGGFAGLFAVRALRSGPVAVTLVDRCAHHLFQPLLYQCASGILSEGQIAQPLRAVLRRHPQVRCLQATATDVDVARRVVHAQRPDGGGLEPGAGPGLRRLGRGARRLRPGAVPQGRSHPGHARCRGPPELDRHFRRRARPLPVRSTG